MKKLKVTHFLVIIIIVSLLVIAGVNIYIQKVTQQLWDKSVTDIMEISTQGKNKLDTSLYKDFESINILSRSLSTINPDNTEMINQFTFLVKDNEEIKYLIVAAADQTYIQNGIRQKIAEKWQNISLNARSSGVSDPFYDRETGIRVIGLFKSFSFADGSYGLVVKEIPLSSMAENFTLSFYDNNGFSYIAKDDGTIIIRSSHKNSNRTFNNLSDIISYEGNSAEAVDSFYQALEKDESGLTILSNKNEDNIFCYLPIETAENWYMISIIPKRIIDEQANNIIQLTLILCIFVIIAILIILAVYQRNTKHYRDEITDMAHYDKLTKLYNFEYLREIGTKFLHKNVNNMAAVYVDMINFKAINDIFGYEAGDEILRQMADTIHKSLNSSSYAGRVAADNFIILYHYENRKQLERYIKQLMETLKKQITDLTQDVVVKAGICCMEDEKKIENINQFIDRARIAHRVAKKSNENYIYYTKDMREKMINDAKMEAEMESALKNHEFETYLQPKYDSEGKQIQGAEALVRWIRPDGSMYYPDSFIPLFERNGFILKLDTYIFESVCSFLHERMQNKEHLFPISVNISRVHLFHKEFISTYAAIKKKYAIPDRLLILEITESILAEDLVSIQNILNKFHELGFMISIDDFGSGYSSLNILKELPVDSIKLDRVFLSPIEDEVKSEIIIQSIIKMADKLGIISVAEGVETKEQLIFLKKAGCKLIQGYIFARPMPINEFLNMLNHEQNV